MISCAFMTTSFVGDEICRICLGRILYHKNRGLFHIIDKWVVWPAEICDSQQLKKSEYNISSHRKLSNEAKLGWIPVLWPDNFWVRSWERLVSLHPFADHYLIQQNLSMAVYNFCVVVAVTGITLPEIHNKVRSIMQYDKLIKLQKK